MRFLRSAFAALALAALPAAFPAPVQAQTNYTTNITLLHLLNGGVAVPYATFCAQPADMYGNPIAVSASSWGFLLPTTPICANVVNGAISGGLNVPDAAHTYAASPIDYNFTIQVTTSSGTPIGQALLVKAVSGVTGATFSFDQFSPNVSAVISPSQVLGYASSVPSSCTAPSLFTSAVTGVLYKCFQGTYSPIVGGSLVISGAYSSGTTYAAGTVVSYSGSSYISLVNSNVGHEPDTSPGQWALLAAGGGSGGTSSSTYTLGYLDGSSSNSCGNSAGFTVVNQTAATQSGSVTSFEANVASFTAGTGQLSLNVYSLVSGTTYQLVSSTPLTVTATGAQTWTAPTFTAPNITVGQYVGYFAGPNVCLEFGGNNPTTALTAYNAGSETVGGTTSYSQGGSQSTIATITVPGSSSSSSASSSPYTGLRLGVWGHSLTTPGYEYTGVTGTSYTYWQQDLAATLGMTWTFNDGCPGGGFFNFFHNYPGISLTNLTAASTGNTCGSNGGLNGAAQTSGTTLAADLANVDVLLIWEGDNDYGEHGTGITGSPGDAVAANTNYGDLDNALSILFTVKPTLRVMLIDHGYAGRSFGIAGYQAIRTWEQNAGAYYGVGVMDMLTISGLNPLTWTTWQNNDSGQYLHPTNTGWAHFVPIIARHLNGY